MAPGEIHLAMFPFGGSIGAKVRPVLTLTGFVGPTPEVLVAYITSVVPSALLPSDLLLDPSTPEYSTTKLKVVSLLRLHKLATIHGSDFARLVGVVTPTVWSDIETKLKVLLHL